MTDEQFLWLFINQAIDTEEKLEKMCPKCRAEATSDKHKCIICGKTYNKDGDNNSDYGFVNPNFNAERFNKLSSGLAEDHNDIEESEEEI